MLYIPRIEAFMKLRDDVRRLATDRLFRDRQHLEERCQRKLIDLDDVIWSQITARPDP